MTEQTLTTPEDTTPIPDHHDPADTETEATVEGGPAGGPPPAADPREEGAELVWADPAELILAPNVRLDVALDKEFLADIAAYGVHTPINGQRDAQGQLVVKSGQRRLLAAMRTGRRIPVFVDPRPYSEDADATVTRIVDQLGENHHRAGMTAHDRVTAHQQLLDLGLSAGQIAKRTHLSRKESKTLHTVAGSGLAAGALARHEQLDLAQAAAIAEFDDGEDTDREIVAALLAAAIKSPTQFEHVLQRARDDREEAQLIRAAEQRLRAEGVRVLNPHDTTPHEDGDDTRGERWEPTKARALGHLLPGADTPRDVEFTAAAHASCPGHAAKVSVPRRYDGQPREARITYCCTDPAVNGHVERYPSAGRGTVARTEELSETERDERREERRRTIRLNKEWDSATTVRRRWVTQLLARKTVPKNAGRFIAAVLTRGSHPVRKAMETGNKQACALLGLPEPGGYGSPPSELPNLAAQASPQRATQLSLAVLLGGMEQSLGRHSWRNVDADTRLYLTTLREWGYGLSEVEAIAAGDTPPPDDTADPQGSADPDQEAPTVG